MLSLSAKIKTGLFITALAITPYFGVGAVEEASNNFIAERGHGGGHHGGGGRHHGGGGRHHGGGGRHHDGGHHGRWHHDGNWNNRNDFWGFGYWGWPYGYDYGYSNYSNCYYYQAYDGNWYYTCDSY